MLPVGVWLLRVVALVAYAVSGCPCCCAWLVRLRGVPCVRVALFTEAACVCLCAPGFAHGVWWCVRVARFISGEVFCCACRGVPARLFVCRLCPVASLVACLLCFGLFDGYCMFVRFVSAPARGVTLFMLVCAGARLTATLVVAYCLLCKGRFQLFALSTSVPVVFVSVSYHHKGWWGESGGCGRWRLVA